MLDQRRRRWDDVVQMLYKCFVSAGIPSNIARSPNVLSMSDQRLGIMISMLDQRLGIMISMLDQRLGIMISMLDQRLGIMISMLDQRLDIMISMLDQRLAIGPPLIKRGLTFHVCWDNIDLNNYLHDAHGSSVE